MERSNGSIASGGAPALPASPVCPHAASAKANINARNFMGSLLRHEAERLGFLFGRRERVVAGGEVQLARSRPADERYRGARQAHACSRRDHRPSDAPQISVGPTTHPVAFEASC